MINCNENENDNGNIDHINKKYIDQNVDIETNITFLDKIMSLCSRQNFGNI